MHFLDLIMYFITSGIIWFIIDKTSNGEYTNELGTIIGIIIMSLYTIIYTILFAFYPDWNWVDFHIDINVLKDFFKL